LGRKSVVRLGDERHYDVSHGRVAWIENRDPVLSRVDGVRQDPIHHRVIRIRHPAHQLLECRPTHSHVEPEYTRSRQVAAGGIEVTAFHRLDPRTWEGLEREARSLASFLRDRDPNVYSRYNH
jgi:hypothetical protein